MKKELFGITKTGEEVYKFILTNSQGMEAHVLTYGATLQKLIVPCKDGSLRDVVLGFNSFEQYEGDHPYICSFVGRNANRIAGGKLNIGGKEVYLTENEGINQLHGGAEGFHRKNWEYQVDGDTLKLSYLAVDGEEGFPGNLKVETTFRLTDDNSIAFTYEAQTDEETIVNLTRHEYFNLDQLNSKTIKKHTVQINAAYYTPVDANGIPTGEITAVKNTAMNLQEPKILSEALEGLEGGYDHNYVLNERDTDVPAAIVISPENVLTMEIFCTQPGLQFYSANETADLEGKYGKYGSHAPALCLEPQHFPDAPHHANFPSTVLKPDEKYKHTLVYHFKS